MLPRPSLISSCDASGMFVIALACLIGFARPRLPLLLRTHDAQDTGTPFLLTSCGLTVESWGLSYDSVLLLC